jgi:DNA invertase Pin-like site-specific DNA recombinase
MTLRAVIWAAVSTPEQAEDEKESLPAQRRDLLRACEEHGWQVIDILEVPGFSRRYLDLDEFAEDAVRENIFAGRELRRHLKQRDFDVFVCRDGDRFGRSQSLFSRVAEDILFVQHKFIFALNGGGLISETNGGREWITMQSYRASKHVDDLVRWRNMGMDRRAARGLPTTSQIPMTHLLIRDEKGDAAKLIVNNELRPMFNRVAELIIEGVPWREIEVVLFERYQYGVNGKPWHNRKMQKLIYSPTAWGHSARHYRGADHKWHTTGLWQIEPGHDPPEGVKIWYNTHEPLYTGDLAERLKAELYRRDEIVRGRTTSNQKFWFTGLFICQECGYTLNLHINGSGRIWMRCTSRYRLNHNRETICDMRRMLPEDKARAQISGLLSLAVEGDNMNLILGKASESAQSLEHQIQEVGGEIERLEAQVRQMIRRQAQAGEEVQSLYEKEIAVANEQLKLFRKRRKDLQNSAALPSVADERQAAFDEIKAITLMRLWDKDQTEINQLLHRLLGKRRFIVADGNVVMVNEPPKLRGRD